MSQRVGDLPTNQRPDISKPRWDQSLFNNRLKHFFTTVNPLHLLASNSKLDEAKSVVTDYKLGKYHPTLTVDQLWHAKNLYDATFHPDTGEKMVLIGRMSAQVPCNMVMSGGMMSFYRSKLAIVSWQFFNQSFNCVVNFTNRSGEHSIPTSVILQSYFGATGGALTAALGIKALTKTAPPIVARFIPFVAVAVANAINIPLSRQSEFSTGIEVEDESGTALGKSTLLPYRACTLVCLGRIMMAFPTMAIPAVIMDSLDRRAWFQPYKRTLSVPLTVSLVGLNLLWATPLGCALFPQKAPIHVNKLEPELREKIAKMKNPPEIVYYNRGL